MIGALAGDLFGLDSEGCGINHPVGQSSLVWTLALQLDQFGRVLQP